MPQRSPFDFTPYLTRWRLQPDGAPIATHCSDLLPVRAGDTAAMLKIAHEAEERLGGLAMQYWNGEGAARVFAYEGEALLLERATGTQSLVAMVLEGRDDEASRILCRVAARLHAPRGRPLPDLLPLASWFEALEPGAARYGGILVPCAAVARELFAEPQDIVTLHGDLHHENVLDGGAGRGWIAIDPKRLVGERGYDFANIVCNPERDLDMVTSPGRLLRQVDVIAAEARLERRRLLQWILAYAGLSAAWILDDGDTPVLEFAVATIVADDLGL
jgi:streptomycin 6-kinase